jgi:hypothetical protein
MVDKIKKHLAEIAHLDSQIDDLQEERDTHTDPLEKAAHAYHEAHPSRGQLDCSACRFTYEGTRNNGETVVFYTECNWCEQSFGGLNVAASELVKYMEGED